MNKVEDITVNGGLHWHPLLRERVSRGRLHAGRRLHASRQLVQPAGRARQLLDPRLQAGRSRVHRAASVPSPRRSLSLLGGWREATQVGFYGLGTDTSTRRPDELRLPAAVRARRSSTFWPTRELLMLRGGLECRSGRSSPAKGPLPSVETVYTPRRCPASAPKPPICTRRARSASTGARRPATRVAAASTASRCTTTPTATRRSASGRSTTRRSSTFRSCARRGSSRCAAVADHASTKDDQEIPFFMLPSLGGGSNLRGYQQLALPRSQQPAPAGGVAHHGQPLHGHGVLL